ncbi:MAG TPA: threonylcarbamoyl-AMP synthase [Porphyromonadaceae bacterium]|nr:threonylcarbamoyl-AMP synthase [Porphyromonadaceae bacterium]
MIKLYKKNPNERLLMEVVEVLKKGELIIYPTDTLYAIGCDALNARAVEEICKFKGIDPKKTNLSIVCDSISRANEYAKIDNRYFSVLKKNTPGAFTFIFNSNHKLPKVFRGRKNIGIRIPDNEITLSLVRLLDRPLLTTSVRNLKEPDEYLTYTEEINEQYKNRISTIIDGDECLPQPSTIVDCTGEEIKILREGAGFFRE